MSEALLSELARALAYPKLATRIPAADAAGLVEALRGAAVVAPDPADPPPRSPDPDDDYLLALAEQERAVLVTGDQHLLGLQDQFPIVMPRAFLDELRAAESR